MSKQDIEKRLGFAAQGVKETTRSSAKAEFVRFIDLETWKNSKGTVFTAGIEDDAGRFQPYVTARDSSGGDQLQTRSAPTFKTEQGARKWLNTWMQNHKSTSSRPGAKAAFASPKYRAFVYRGSPSSNILVKATEWMDSASAAEDAAKQVVMSFRDKPGYNSNNYFADIAQETPEGAKTVKNYIRFSRPGVKAKMALTISTVGAKNLCYEALANLGELAKLASETKSGWGFHVTVMTDHVKSAMSQLESSPAQAGTYLERAIDTLGMLRKIDPVRLNDIQKGSFKQLIGYVAKSLRDAKANIKVVTTASRPGAKAKFEKEYVLWGLPKGETDRLHEKVPSTQAKTPAQMEDVKKRASAAGWHSFRVQILDLSKPYKGFARPTVKAKA